MLTFGSLFSGIGGFDLGFERAGMKCAWQCEIDQKCQEVLSKRFGVKVYDDVKIINRGAEPIDLICGGFPCQDLSIAGKRKGLAGERSGLWFEFARIIEEIKPKWVVIENVPGLLSSNRGADFAVVLSGLVKFGYGVSWRILDAQYFGVAQRRRRVFIVGSLGSGDSAKVLFESESVSRDPAESRKTGKGITNFSPSDFGTYSERLGTLRGEGGDVGGGSENLIGFDLAQITSKLNYSNPKSGDPQPPLNLAAQGMVAYENHPADSRITETGEVCQMLTSRMGTGGGNVPLVANTISGGSSKCHSDITIGQGDGNIVPVVMSSTQSNAGIVSDGSPSLTSAHDHPIVCATSWTLRTGKEGGGKGYLGNENQAMTLGGQPQFVGVRRLTPTECARLQGFPDDWNDWQSDSTRYKQFGNAVCVNVAEWIGKRIVELDK